MSKPGGDPSFGISSGDDMILPGRHPACRRREAQSGSCTERENLCCDAKGEVTSGYHREGESTDAEHRDGAARSSAEGPVMGVGAKGLRCSAEAVGQLATGGACGRGKAVRDPETGGLGSFRACEGEPGSGWSGWTVDSRVRGQPCGQPLQALESDVLGEPLPSGGPPGRDKYVCNLTQFAANAEGSSPVPELDILTHSPLFKRIDEARQKSAKDIEIPSGEGVEYALLNRIDTLARRL